MAASTCASTSECGTPAWAAVEVGSETMELAGIVPSPKMGYGRLGRVCGCVWCVGMAVAVA